MAHLRVDRPIVVTYPSIVEFRAYVDHVQDDEYLDFFWTNDQEDVVEEILNHNYTGKYIFKINNEANINVTSTVFVYKYNMAGEKLIQEILTETVSLYESTLEDIHRFGLPPRPTNYDTTYQYQNTLTIKDLDFEIWQPNEKLFELPYYYPVIVTPLGGIPPYIYEFVIDASGMEIPPPHSMFSSDGVCSLIFPQLGIYQLNIKVIDSTGISLSKSTEIRALPEESVTSYKFDTKPVAKNYDGWFIDIKTWSPPKNVFSKNNNYYVGQFKLKINLDGLDMTINDVLSQIKFIMNRTLSPDQMWERYYASKGFSFYHSNSRAAMYYASRTSLQSIYVDDDENIGFNLRLTSDYPLASAVARMFQAFRWVISTNKIPYTFTNIDFKYEFKNTAHSDVVLDGMKEYVTDLVRTKYARVELDERFEAIQTDVEVYLGKEHTYEHNGSDGYANID